MMISPEHISIIIAAAGFAASVYFSTKSLKSSIATQERKREADRAKHEEDAVNRAEKDATRHTQIMERLNLLMANTDENKREISDLKSEVKRLNDTQISNVQRVEAAFSRIEKVESRLEMLHKEHRENMGRCRFDE